MRKIILIIGFGLLGLWGLFGIIWAATSFNNPNNGMGLTLQVAQVAMSPYFIPGIIIFMLVMFGAAFSPLITGSLENRKKKKRLQQIGQKTMAKILSIQNTGIRVNNNPYVKMSVEVKPGITANFQMIVSLFQVPQVGDSIEILYDPANPSDAVPVH